MFESCRAHLAERDVVAAISEHADAWGVSLQDAAAKARDTGQAALVAIEGALSEISTLPRRRTGSREG